MRRFFWAGSVLLVVGTCVIAALFVWRGDREQPQPAPAITVNLPKQVNDNGYVSSSACRECHENEYESWHDTYHRTMTQVASPQTVAAPFDGIHLKSRGREYHLERRGEEFWVRMADPNWEGQLVEQGFDVSRIEFPRMAECRVVLTTGSHHMQQYWVQGKRGRELWALPWFYVFAEKRWIPREDALIAPPEGGRHFKIWNIHCISCHSVAGQPGLEESPTISARWNTRVAEFGVACEACHGPGKQHISHHRVGADEANTSRRSAKDPIVNPARLDAQAGSQVCGQCHAGFYPRDFDQWIQTGSTYRPGGDLDATRHLMRFKDPFFEDEPLVDHGYYWPDGTQRVGGREFLGLIASTCYQSKSLSCLSCHSMHNSDPNDQLGERMEGDEACLQCHSSYSDRIEQHTHHRPDSAGSLCYNCHMPYQAYGLFKAIRTHRIDIPSATTSVQTGRPNACNQCHVDKTLGWTATHLNQWYGAPMAPMSQDEKEIAASVLWLLRGDAAQRVLAAWTLGWDSAQEASGNDWQAPLLAELLEDPYSAVRYVASRSLRTFKSFRDLEYDFVAPPDERSRVKADVRRLWNEMRDPSTARNKRNLLFDESGHLIAEEIERLRNDRDDTPVEISE